jgi:S-adenosylmethionine:tRNA ribosyltransferase-isomerase
MSEFTYNLPEELIAQFPPKTRGTTNLLVLDKESGEINHKKYFNIPEYINKGDVVVLNETKVINSRTFFITPRNNTQVQVLFLEDLGEEKWYCLIKYAKCVHEGDILTNSTGSEITINVLERKGPGFVVQFKSGTSEQLFTKYGHTPLPPYMKREDKESDKVRYNTVFADIPGAVAAPTASLNLTDEILKDIKEKGAEIAKIELRVGWGTFAPIREENIEEHNIHSEYISVSKESADIINNCIKNVGKVWAFGTTVARTLESVSYLDKESGKYFVKSYNGDTNLYIYPGYEWKIVNTLVTNFHAPDSSLILLVSAFAGKENIKKTYAQAIEKRYAFLSYGDSMLIK